MAWEMMAFASTVAGMCVGCLVPNRWLPQLPNDKLMHFSGFAFLGILAVRMADGAAATACWLAGLVVGGWLLECLQMLVPDRGFCWRDMGANAAGVAVAAFLSIFM